MSDKGEISGPVRSRRTFSEPTGKGHVSMGDKAHKLRLLAWSPVGGFLGLIFGLRASYGGIGGLPLIVLSTVLGWALVYYGPQLAMHAGGSFISSIYNPRGSREGAKREYSQAESLVARGLYPEAIDAFEMEVLEAPSVPEPYLRVARIYRDNLEQFEDAARWFRRARREAELHDGLKLLVTRELVELYITKIGSPAKALPELARLAEEQEGTPEGQWAASELRRLKHGESDGDEVQGGGAF